MVYELLEKLGLKFEDIDYVLMIYFYFDYVFGLIKWEDDYFVLLFLNVKVYVSEIEWNEMRNLNIRLCNIYWKENWELIVD